MRSIDIVRLHDRLDRLFQRVASIDDDELKAHWARYLCILTCGYLENSIKAVFGQFASKQSSPRVQRYVERHLDGLKNPGHEKIAQLVGAFDARWSEEFCKETDGEIRDHVVSLVANRNQIAHGKDCTVTVAAVQSWFRSVKRLISCLETKCGQVPSVTVPISK